MVVMDANRSPSPSALKYLLRLDNGALIGDSGRLQGQGSGSVVRLPADKAFAAGRVKEADVARLEHILVQMHSKVPDAGPLTSLQPINTGEKRKSDHLMAGDLPDGKRARDLNGHQDVADASPSAASRGASAHFQPGDIDKCLEITNQLIADLGQDVAIFDRPVDPKLVPDYRKIIKEPMDLGTIKSNLQRSLYNSPAEFARDVRQVWVNCHIYNPKDTYIAKLGSREEALFEHLWAGSGMAEDARHRRLNAGVAAHKYEPALGVPEKKSSKKPTSSKQTNGKQGKSSKGGGRRASSADNSKEMSRELMKVLAEDLQSLTGEHLEGAIAILKEQAGANRNEDDEIELDFDTLDNVTLWKIHAYIRRVVGGRGGRNGVGPSTSFRMEEDSDDGTDSDDDSR